MEINGFTIKTGKSAIHSHVFFINLKYITTDYRSFFANFARYNISEYEYK